MGICQEVPSKNPPDVSSENSWGNIARVISRNPSALSCGNPPGLLDRIQRVFPRNVAGVSSKNSARVPSEITSEIPEEIPRMMCWVPS